jgi:hypothetical protein
MTLAPPMPKTMPDNTPNPEELVGEILDRRYALLESQGPWRQGHRYLAYDMEELVQVQLLLFHEAAKPRYLVLTPSTPPPLPPPPADKRPDPFRLAPPPADKRPDPSPVRLAPPPADKRPDPSPVRLPPPSMRQRLDTGRLVAAWFARGEQLEQLDQEVDEEALESPEEIERLARELPEEAFRKFAL